MDAVSRTPVPVNEPVRQYQPGSHERAVLESKIKELSLIHISEPTRPY